MTETLSREQADALLQRCEYAYAEQCRKFISHHTMPADQDAIKWAAERLRVAMMARADAYAAWREEHYPTNVPADMIDMATETSS